MVIQDDDNIHRGEQNIDDDAEFEDEAEEIIQIQNQEGDEEFDENDQQIFNPQYEQRDQFGNLVNIDTYNA